MRYNEIFGLRFFDVVEKKEPEIAVREMGGGWYSDEITNIVVTGFGQNM